MNRVILSHSETPFVIDGGQLIGRKYYLVRRNWDNFIDIAIYIYIYVCVKNTGIGTRMSCLGTYQHFSFVVKGRQTN